MNMPKKEVLPRGIIVVSAIVIAVCFALSSFTFEMYAKEDCFSSIEETTSQISKMFLHSTQQSYDQLELLADILAANDFNTKELLQTYMETFCESQAFSAVCVHQKDGAVYSYGAHPHDVVQNASFEAETANPTHLSQVYSLGALRSQQYVYQSAPIIRDGDAVAVLYGFISLDTFPALIGSTAYAGNCQFYIVDGSNGNFLMDEYHRAGPDGTELPLGNLYDGSMGDRETKPGYNIEDMRGDIAIGQSGYYIFKSQRTGQWYYTYYMPMGIHNWSMQLTIDEPTAFARYDRARFTVSALMLCVIASSLVIIFVMLRQNRKRQKADLASLCRASYLNAVRGALITAHNNSGFVDRALQVVAEEMEAETALLLSFKDNTITGAHYWPSKSKPLSTSVIGRSIRDDFPGLYDVMLAGKSFIHNAQSAQSGASGSTQKLLERFGIRRLVLVPILDTNGEPKAALAVANSPVDKSTEILECVTYDFFMAITNLESHNIIKQMGTIDYLTGVKNRNSFEAETAAYEILDAENLWCVFVDVNALHKVNNTQGHKAGDIMLCAVASTMKKIFGFEHVYRLGGDEFLAFKANSTHDALMNCKYRLLAELEKKGYPVSVGFEGTTKNENGIFDIDQILTEAEKIMYREKRKFYMQNDLSPSRCPFPPSDAPQ